MFKTDFFAKYEFIHDLRWAFSPEVDINHAFHTRRSVAEVFQNDALSLTPALRSRLEHQWLDAPAAAQFDVEYNHVLKDYLQNHTYPFYSSYFNFILGERAKFVDLGNTTMSGNFKILKNEDTGQNAIDPGITINQNFRWEETSLSINLSGDYNRATDHQNDRINYRLNTSFFTPDLFCGLDLSVNLDLTLIDTRLQKDSRGYERTISPGLSLRKNWDKNFYTALSYNYTKNISKDTENYAYVKSIVGLGVGVNF